MGSKQKASGRAITCGPVSADCRTYEVEMEVDVGPEFLIGRRIKVYIPPAFVEMIRNQEADTIDYQDREARKIKKSLEEEQEE